MLLALICGMCEAVNQNEDLKKHTFCKSKLHHITGNWYDTHL